MALTTYSTGTVSVTAGGTTVTGVGTIWNGNKVVAGDEFVIGANRALIVEVISVTELTITPWPGSDESGSTYEVYQTSSQRFDDVDLAVNLGKVADVWTSDGFYIYVPSDATEPDPSLGNDGQFAFQAATGKLWAKESGVWSFLGIYKGFSFKGEYDSGTAYVVNDVITSDGSAYIVTTPTTGNAPPNASYYAVLSSKGDQGIQGVQGASYGGTSTTSLAIGTGSNAFTTQAGLAYANGARVRASSAADTSNWMEGLVTYSGTTLTMASDKTNGSGTHTDWSFNIAGVPGAGDLSSANNLSDLASAATALTNLGGTTVGKAVFTAADAAAARAATGAPKGYLFGLILSNNASDATNDIDIAAGEAADGSGNLMVLASGITKRVDAAWAVGTNQGGLDTGTVSTSAIYHMFLIQRSDTGVVDVCFSVSSNAPTTGGNIPSAYDRYRRIGAIIRSGGSNKAFEQTGDEFYTAASALDYNNSSLGTTRALVVLSVPLNTTAIVNAYGFNPSSGCQLLVHRADATDVAPASRGPTLSVEVANGGQAAEIRVPVNGSSQIAVRADRAGCTLQLNTLGWIDTRGKLN